MKTLRDVEDELFRAEEKVKELKKTIAAKQAATPLQKFADYLHGKFCSSNHTDACSWSYEGDDWEQGTHIVWLKKADEVLKESRKIP